MSISEARKDPAGGWTTRDDLADRIYEAAVIPDLWRGTLNDLAVAAGGQAALLSTVRSDTVRAVFSSDAFSETWQRIFRHFPGASNERTKRLLAARHPGFLTDADVFDPLEIASDPLYTDILIPSGYGSGVATAIPYASTDAAVINIERSAALGSFGKDEIRLLDGLRPHLARAAMLSAHLAFEQARSAVQTLEALGLSACAASADGTVLLANAGFASSSAFWSTRGGDRLALFDSRAKQLMEAGLRQIGSSAGVRSIPVRSDRNHPPAVLHLIPIRRAAHDLFGRAAAILVLAEASARPAQATPLLQALFDLTPAEAELAALIAAGQTVEHIAAGRGRSVETIRNQLKSVLGKTGCRRQLDLARLLTQLVPAASGPVQPA